LDDHEKQTKKEKYELKGKSENITREMARYGDLLNLREQEIQGLKGKLSKQYKDTMDLTKKLQDLEQEKAKRKTEEDFPSHS